MARKTFGRAGQIIVVPASGDSESISISEAELDGEPVSIDGDGRVEILDSADQGDPSESIGDFVAVGEPIRTQSIRTDSIVASDRRADTDADTGPSYNDPINATGKRPRKPRGPNKPKQASAENTRIVSVQLEKVLFALHTMAAATLAEPELAIDEDEAKILAEAIEKVANAYNFSAMFSAKTQASVDLCIALVTVYGRRVMTIAKRPHKTVRNVTPIDKVGQ
jgi:hypothetical protein